MVDMAYTVVELEEKRRKMGENAPEIGDMEKYPWGTRLRLDHGSLKKLGFSAQIGQEVSITAKARVVEMEANEEADDDVRQHVSLQVTNMDIAGAGTDRQAQAKSLYGKKEGE